MNKSNLLLFFILIVVTLLFNMILRNVLNFDMLLLKSLEDKFSDQSLKSMIRIYVGIEKLSYFFIPLFLILKVTVISVILYFGIYFFEKSISYQRILNIAIKGEFIFIGVIILKIIWIYFHHDNYSLKEAERFYPLSAINFVDKDDLEIWFVYPLQTLNLFEFFYWFFLISSISKELKISIKKGLKIIASSYGIAMIIWISGMMFLMLNVG